jgi:hypothetical protein
MDDQLRSILTTLADEKTAEPKSLAPDEPPEPQLPQDLVDEEVRQALDICRGDAIAALRTTLIANAFLEAQVEELTAQISTGYGRRKNQMKSK